MLDPTPPPVPLLLRLWAWVTVAAALPLAFLGAEVTTKQVGMADPKGFRWPWQLLSAVDGTSDAPSLGLLIEHGHRVFGFLVGNCCIVLAIGTLVFARGWRRLLGLAALAAVGVQGVLGIYRVDRNAQMGDGLALLHGCTAQLVFGTLVAVAVLCTRAAATPATTSAGLRVAGPILAAVVYVQIVFGAVTRHLLHSHAQRLHVLLAFVVLGLIFYVHGKLSREAGNVAAKRVCHWLTLLVFVQPILGVEAWMRRFGSGTLPELLPPDRTLDLIRSGHHLVGTALFTTSVALALLLWRPRTATAGAALPERLEAGA